MVLRVRKFHRLNWCGSLESENAGEREKERARKEVRKSCLAVCVINDVKNQCNIRRIVKFA